MGFDAFLEQFRDQIEELQTVYDRSLKSENNGMCYPVEDWILSVIAVFAAPDKIMDSERSLLGKYPQKVFEELVNKAFEEITNGSIAEEYYGKMASKENRSLTMSGIENLAKQFCRSLGSDWDAVIRSLNEGNSALVSGGAYGFVALLVNKKEEMMRTLEQSDRYSSISDELYVQWSSAILASYCWQKTSIWSFINDRFVKYFDRWRIGESDERFPYAMKTKRYVWYREHPLGEDDSETKKKGGGKTIWDEEEKSIKKYEKDYLNGLNIDRYIYYKGEYRKVEPVGYLYEYDKDEKKYVYIQKGRGDHVKLSDSSEYVKMKDIDTWFIKEGNDYIECFDMVAMSINDDTSSRAGKGSPEMMNYVAKRLRESETSVIKSRAELKKFAMGIDCSGMVSRAILDIMSTLHIPFQTQLKTLGAGYGRLKSNATSLRKDGSTELFSYRYGKGFTSGKIPNEPDGDYCSILQPGDIIMHMKLKDNVIQDDDFHIMIIKDVYDDYFEVMESSAGNDGEGPVINKATKTDYVLDRKKLEKKGGFETVWEYARPFVFNDISDLSTYYVDYLERGEQTWQK